MPMSEDFEERLLPVLDDICDHFSTPFHIYDETGILQTGKKLKNAFQSIDFREYFAVKALPTPRILEIMKDMGFGFDCSSIAELFLGRKAGGSGDDIMFTSNNTSTDEFNEALARGGCILNLDDISLIDKVPKMPELISFRYNPGPGRTGNPIIGDPAEAKYGLCHDQMVEAYKKSIKMGAKRFGLHTMLISNELHYQYMADTAKMILDVAKMITKELGIKFEFINLGGGLGIPYSPGDSPLDLEKMAELIIGQFKDFAGSQGYMPSMLLESGRYMTGPHGVLVTRAINKKETYREYIGVDACMSALMRPALYKAYHEITVHGKKNYPKEYPVDIVGALCENNDKFAIQRPLPKIEDGDLIIIHDTGAHGHSMGFNYNGRLRPKELLIRKDGAVELIRREETLDDIFATLNFKEDLFLTKQG